MKKLINLLASIWLYRLVRWVLSITFLYAGTTKLMDPEAFAVIINDFGLLPEGWIMPLAIGLPVLEIGAALGLVFEVRGSLAVITGLLVFFIVILGYAMWLGLDIDCGCFGPEDPESRAYGGLRSALYRDLVMMAGVVYMYLWRSYCSSTRKNQELPF
ncbi:MAG: DoxX family membrane protein [Desulfobulbaceae bacterium]|nr:DoxX family membrane protein [Desulfobulbaceae bacterium]